MPARSRHQKKEVEEALQHAEAHGWTVEDRPGRGHASHVARCHVACTVWVWHTPANPANHARQIRRAVDNCPHATEDPDA